MPSLYAPPVPADTLLGTAVLSCVVNGVRAYWAAMGEVTLESEDEVHNAGASIAGVAAPVAGLDRIVASSARVRGDFVEASAARLAELGMLAAVPAAVAGVTTIQPPSANDLLSDAQAVADVYVEFGKGDGGVVRVTMTRAMRVEAAVAGRDRSEGTITIVLAARQVWDGVP